MEGAIEKKEKLNSQLKLLMVYNKIKSGTWKTRGDVVGDLFKEELGKLEGEEYKRKFDNKKRTVTNIINRINKTWGTDISYDEKKQRFVIHDEGDLRSIGEGNRLSVYETYLILATMRQSSFVMPDEFGFIKRNCFNVFKRDRNVFRRRCCRYTK
jgi:hypothetical protein